MRVVVAYDVATTDPSGPQRLRAMGRLCKGFGVRVQYSVFECLVSDAQWVKLRARLLTTADLSLDSLRFYFLSEDDAQKTEHHGQRSPLDIEGPLLL